MSVIPRKRQSAIKNAIVAMGHKQTFAEVKSVARNADWNVLAQSGYLRSG
jgi:hypothetical protein